MKFFGLGFFSFGHLLYYSLTVTLWSTDVTAAPSLQKNIAGNNSIKAFNQLRRVVRQERAAAKKGSAVSVKEEFEENDAEDSADYRPASSSSSKRPGLALTPMTSSTTTSKPRASTPLRTTRPAARATVSNQGGASGDKEDSSDDTADSTEYKQKQDTILHKKTETGKASSSVSRPVLSTKRPSIASKTSAKKVQSAEQNASNQEEQIESGETAEQNFGRKGSTVKGTRSSNSRRNSSRKEKGKSKEECGVDYSLLVQSSNRQQLTAVIKSLFAIRMQSATASQASKDGRAVPLTSAVQISVACMTLTIHGSVSQSIISERAGTSKCSNNRGSWNIDNSLTSITAGPLLASLWDNTLSGTFQGTDCRGAEDSGLALLVDGLYISLQGVPALAAIIDYSDKLLLSNSADSCKATSSRIPVYGLDIFSLASDDGTSNAISLAVSAQKRHNCRTNPNKLESSSVLMILRGNPNADGSCDSSSFMSSESESSSDVSEQSSSSNSRASTSGQESSGIELANKDKPASTLTKSLPSTQKGTKSSAAPLGATTPASSLQKEEGEEDKVGDEETNSLKGSTGALSVASRATTKAAVVRTTLSNKPSNSGQSVSTDEVEKDEETTNAESSTGRSTSGRSTVRSAALNTGSRLTSGRMSSLNATTPSIGTSVNTPRNSTSIIPSSGTSINQSVSIPQMPAAGPGLPGAAGIDSYGGNPMDKATGYNSPPAAAAPSNAYGPSSPSNYASPNSQSSSNYGASGSSYGGDSYGSGSSGAAYGGGGEAGGGQRLGLGGPIGFPGVLSPFGFGGLGLGLSWLTPFPLFWGGMNGYFGFAGANSY